MGKALKKLRGSDGTASTPSDVGDIGKITFQTIGIIIIQWKTPAQIQGLIARMPGGLFQRMALA